MIGLEVHVELSTRSKMFSRAPNPAHRTHDSATPNTLTDATVLALPGSLPVINRQALEMAILVGLALGCRIASRTRFDRKSYFYPDLPRGYQISQYGEPLCFDGLIELPRVDDQEQPVPGAESVRVGIVRAHLEEDAGKLLHEAPGGAAIDFSIVDLNRAGAPLLEIVTGPDFDSAAQAVAFARWLRTLCRFLGVSEGVMQKGHMRFEPNVNAILTLDDGRTVRTPITEIKNINSFRFLRQAIEYELAQQPARWEGTGLEQSPGNKRTCGWDARRGVTVPQRQKEEAHDYRYFPDPDLPPVEIPPAWVQSLRERLGELPHQREARYASAYGLSAREAAALVDERELCTLFEQAVAQAVARGVEPARAGRLTATTLLQSAARRANERHVGIHELGLTPPAIGQVVALRHAGRISAAGADELIGRLCDPTHAGVDVEALAQTCGLLVRHDASQLTRWIEQALERHPQAAADVRAGRTQALGRLIGEVMKLAAGQADAAAVRQELLRRLGDST